VPEEPRQNYTKWYRTRDVIPLVDLEALFGEEEVDWESLEDAPEWWELFSWLNRN